ncbi:MAG: cation transporter [Nevskiaceae bacterium]|nr:MAG: cation transporter [Nevskiaceae bacterium]TBR74320.1 MAG: cation transporter [Nevskiaceae bacterium]
MSAPRPAISRYALLSLVTACAVLALKLTAWYFTASVGLLSDALETLTNVGGAGMAVVMLRIAARPPDEEHAFGHSKAEYFSSGFEGMLVFMAAALIVAEAVPRLAHPQVLDQVGVGLAVAAAAGALNFAVSRVLAAAGRRHRSVALTADARHLMADVWTTVGVVAGVALAVATGWPWIDPLVALAVAALVLRAGWQLMRESAAGLMDGAWPAPERTALDTVLAEFRHAQGPGCVEFHAVRTRQSAGRRFVALHLLVPGDWPVRRGHDLAEQVEAEIAERVPGAIVFIHVEPLEDPRSYDDAALAGKL